MSTRAKIIAVIIAIGAILITFFSSGLYSQPSTKTENKDQLSASDKPQILSTMPTNLDQSTILPNQTIEIHFSQPLENEPETRWSIDPGSDIKASLSADKKTLKLTPNTPFNLGQSYTLFIKSETKFEGKKTLDHEYQYHFKTIEFKGA